MEGSANTAGIKNLKSQTFEELEVKRNVMIHHVKVTHPLLYLSIIRVHSLTIEYSVLSVMAGLIVEMLYILSSVYKTA